MAPQVSSQRWNVLSLLEWGADYLRVRGFDEARLTVDLLLAHVLRLERMNLYLQFDRPLTPSELQEFKSLFKRRLDHEPLQYIVGETSFMGLPLFVDRTVLIPRPETEILVERALETLRLLAVPAPVLLDVGTGSGNIAVALGSSMPQATVVSIDASEEALQTAARNIARHALTNVTLQKADVFSDMIAGRRFHLVVSNPPYVSAEDFDGLQAEVRDFEPRIATTDGGDGYRFLMRLCSLAPHLLESGGALLMEIGYSQRERVEGMMGEAQLLGIQAFNDYAGIPRVVRGWKDEAPGGRG
jgi:release factor glutamine methyltransferase